MTRNRLFLIVAATAVCVGVALGVLAMLPPHPGVTPANFARIENGMTRAEVYEIFGRPGMPWFTKRGWERWDAGDGSWTAIEFRADCVVDRMWHDSPESTFDKIRRWLP
jgi:hypothetical protein